MHQPTVTVVTGASTGIGRATALRMARAGDRVHALVRNPAASRELTELAAAEELYLSVVECDVSSDDSVRRAFAGIRSTDGGIDRLICNAGRYLGSTLEAITMEEIQALFDVNYFGAIRCIKEVLPAMREARSGVIVAVTSQSAQMIFPTWTAYSGSKRALEASLESLAMEMRPFGVRVGVIQPGITLTAMRGKIEPRVDPADYAELLNRYRTIIAADRTESLTPDDVARAIEQVLIDGSSPFRTRVGADAIRNTSLRASVSDEEWIDLFGHDSDDGFFSAWSHLAGVEDVRGLADPALRDPS